MFCPNSNTFPCLKAQVIIRIWSKHTWNNNRLVWKSTFYLQSIPHLKVWVIISIWSKHMWNNFTIWLHILLSHHQISVKIHFWSMWIYYEFNKQFVLQCFCNLNSTRNTKLMHPAVLSWVNIEHMSGKHPPLTHSFVLYKLSHNLIFMEVLFFKKLGQFKSIFISDIFF